MLIGAVRVSCAVMTLSLLPSGFRPPSRWLQGGALRTCAAGPGSC
ncbi:hypothetical protein HMPREF1549_02988, partial [Actinomyces johnsonii F0510]